MFISSTTWLLGRCCVRCCLWLLGRCCVRCCLFLFMYVLCCFLSQFLMLLFVLFGLYCDSRIALNVFVVLLNSINALPTNEIISKTKIYNVYNVSLSLLFEIVDTYNSMSSNLGEGSTKIYFRKFADLTLLSF